MKKISKGIIPIIAVTVLVISVVSILWVRNNNLYTNVTIDTANICNGFQTEVSSQLTTKKVKKSELDSYVSELKARNACFTIED